MSNLTLKDLAKKMAGIDFAMLNTHTDGGAIAARPMSNNGDVEYDGDSWFFVTDDTRICKDVTANPKVSLSMQGRSGIVGQRPFFVAIEGETQIVRDRAAFKDHWTKDLDRWWPQGLDTPGLALLKVHASRLHYWDGQDEGEVRV